MQFLLNLFNQLRNMVRSLWFLRGATQRGRGIRMQGSALVRNEGTIRVGNRVCFHAGPTAVELVTLAGGSIEIADDVKINHSCSFTASGSIRIGKRSRIGIGVIMLDSHLHMEAPERRAERPSARPIVIEDDVWIANRAIILPGVTLGRGCIVGAGSVVTHSVPPDMVALGSPARVVRPTRKGEHPSAAERSSKPRPLAN